MSSKFCPMCISSGGSGKGENRKRRKGHRSSEDSGGSDNDDDNFYRPSKEALKSKTSSISTSDPEQPFHVPAIFKPIRVDSPALFVHHGSGSTVNESRGGKGDPVELPGNASSSEEELRFRSKAVGPDEEDDGDDAHDSADDNNDTSRIGDGTREKLLSDIHIDSKGIQERGKQEHQQRPSASQESRTESHERKPNSKVLTNKADDISKPVDASSSSSPLQSARKKVLSPSTGLQLSPIIPRARPRAGSDFRKKLLQHKPGLPRTSSMEEDDSILNPDEPNRYHQDGNHHHQECAYSLSSQSSRSLSVNYDSHCPDSEARQPLLFASSELDLVSDDEADQEADERRGFVPVTTTIGTSHEEQQPVQNLEFHESEKTEISEGSQAETANPEIFTRLGSTGDSTHMESEHVEILGSKSSSERSTPAPPPLPDCPLPDSESDWSRSGSNTRCPSRSCCAHSYRHVNRRSGSSSASCCTTSPSRDYLQRHHVGASSPGKFDCRGGLALVDMSQIHFADSASSCCGSDVGDVCECNNDRVTDKNLTGPGTDALVSNNSVTAPAVIDYVDDNGHVTDHDNEKGNRSEDGSCEPITLNRSAITSEVKYYPRKLSPDSTAVRVRGEAPNTRKVSTSVNTDVVMPPSFEIDDAVDVGDGNIEMRIMAMDTSYAEEELRSTSTTPTPPKHDEGDDRLLSGGETSEILSRSLLLVSPQQESREKAGRGVKTSSLTITLKAPKQTCTENNATDEEEWEGENKKVAEESPISWKGDDERNSTPENEKIASVMKTLAHKERHSAGEVHPETLYHQDVTRVLAEGFYYSELDLDLALQHKHMQTCGEWRYPYHSTGHVPAAAGPSIPTMHGRRVAEEGVEEEEDEVGNYLEGEEEERAMEDLRPLINASASVEQIGGEGVEVDQSPQVHYQGVRTNVTGSWFSLSSSSSLEDYDESRIITAYGSGGGSCGEGEMRSSLGTDTGGSRSSAATKPLPASDATTTSGCFDPEKWSPESSPSLSILSYEEILLEQRRIQQDVQRVAESVKRDTLTRKCDSEPGQCLFFLVWKSGSNLLFGLGISLCAY